MKNYPEVGTMVEGYNYNAPLSFNEHGWLASGQFPADCIDACSSQGHVDQYVEHWVSKLDFSPPPRVLSWSHI